MVYFILEMFGVPIFTIPVTPRNRALFFVEKAGLLFLWQSRAHPGGTLCG